MTTTLEKINAGIRNGAKEITRESLPGFLQASGLNFKVEAVQERHPITGEKIPFFATMRTDTGRVFQTGFSDRYVPIQNSDSMQAIVDISEGELKSPLHFARASAFDGGARVSVQVDAGEMLIGDPKLNDIVKRRVSFTTSHDGSGSMLIQAAPFRLRCLNGMTAMDDAAARSVSLRHTVNGERRVKGLAESWKDIDAALKRTEIAYNVLAARKVSREDFADVLENIFPTKGLEKDAASRNSDLKVKVASLYKDADAGRTERDTGWNLYNAVTRYYDHFSTVRASDGLKSEAREKSVLFGTIAEKNGRALRQIVEVLNVESDIDRILRAVETGMPQTSGSLVDWVLN